MANRPPDRNDDDPLGLKLPVELEEGELPNEPGTGTLTPLRLVVYHSSHNPASNLLPARQTVAYIDSTTTIGRDKSYDPRIRLKSLEVSKAHATLFYDEQAGSWSIVDTASTHGTFVKSKGDQAWSRLAEKGKASLPRTLQHLDTIKVGSQRFIVHIHPVEEDPQGCPDCAHFVYPEGGDNLVPLLNAAEPSAPTSQTYGKGLLNAAGDFVYENSPSVEAPAAIRSKEEKQVDFKNDLKSLRRQMLSSGSNSSSYSHNKNPAKKRKMDASDNSASRASADSGAATPSNAVGPSQPAYIDRAKLRRALHPAAESESVQASRSTSRDASPSTATVRPVEPSYGPGQALYQKMLGQSSQSAMPTAAPSTKAMGDVIQVRTTQARNAGLGHGELVSGVENIGSNQQLDRTDWRARARDRRWQELQGRTM